MDSIGAAKLREIVINELSRVQHKLRGEEVLIICPFHQDSTPSCGVHIGFAVTPGVFHCFSCGASGSWNKLAQKLNLRQVDYQVDTKITPLDDPFRILHSEISKTKTLVDSTAHVLQGIEDLPSDFEWRGLRSDFYQKLGGRFYWEHNKTNDFEMDWLYFPLTINKQYVGYTVCALKPNKPKYKTFADTSKVFFLYDQIEDGGNIVVCEGHYDALRLLSFGIPAMCIFGVENWSPIKKALLLAKSPKKVFILMDGDEAGHRCAHKVYSDIKTCVETELLLLPITADKLDPGNMPEDYIIALKRKMC